MPACWSDLPLPTLPNGQCHPCCCFALLGEEGCSLQHPRVPTPGPLSSCGLLLGHEGGCRARALCRSSSLPCSPDFFFFIYQSLGCPGWAESQDAGSEVCQQQEMSSAPCAAGATGGVGAALDKARGSELTGQQQGSATSGLLRKFLESST